MDLVLEMFLEGLITRQDYEWMWGEHLKGLAQDAMREEYGTWVSPSRTRMGLVA